MAANKIERFTNLGKIQHQQYEQALAGELKIRQMIDDIDASVVQVKQYQQDYQQEAPY